MIELKNKPEDQELKQYMLALEDPRKKQLVDLGNAIFPNSQKIKLQDRLGEKIKKDEIVLTLTKLKDKYKHVFTLEEIKKECINYNLQFRSTKKYENNYDYDYVAKIKEFLDANNHEIHFNDLQYSFYVLYSEINKKNPLIFYKHKEREEYFYVMIDGDKNYINPINWWLGCKEYGPFHCWLAWTSLVSIFFFLIASIICSFSGLFLTYYLIAGIISGIISIVIACNLENLRWSKDLEFNTREI